MKENELREKAECGLCHRKIGHTGMPVFWTVKIQHWGLKAGAMQRQSGLEQFFGGHVALAQAMGANEDMAEVIGDEIEFGVCQECAMGKPMVIGFMSEETKDE